MKRIARHLAAYYLIYIACIIHLLFYISVSKTGWFNLFFSGAALHEGAKGIDFYQVPRGAWAFWHGGSLTGEPLWNGSQYAKAEFSQNNVYHPFFTIIVGTFLMQFDPASAPYIWLWSKLVITVLVTGYFIWSFRESKHLGFAVLMLLANFSVYLELAAWQFHFVLNVFLLLFLINLVKNRDVVWRGIWYWLSLIVKPIGFLFIPFLFAKGRWRTIVVGALCFGLTTWILSGIGGYYIDNLKATLFGPGGAGPNQIITLNALLRHTSFTHWPDIVYKIIQYSMLVITIFWAAFRRVHRSKVICLVIVYYLFFYEMTFEYHWSTLAYVLPICVVCCPEFQTRWAKACMLLVCLPGCFALLNVLHIDVTNQGYWGLIPGERAWQFMVLSKLIPVFLLCVCVLIPDIKPIFRQTRAFWSAVRRVNEHLQVFGAAEDEEEEEAKEIHLAL
ncbi:glycosyltransferase 87 family protein [Ktedonobacter robiniae]|uniref:DUF2029 domain-containing protein n=1 Tax=Ktedonobacter robiniae TaxID=2778365 RepID=A0ABQ3UX87_9CHLR|nr:glycosyltransferase 87 family protein [Ktedonobacter robiniae]GHO57373.1 hypothetical protein KSB_58480 [Ktedonobacter robiniae]